HGIENARNCVQVHIALGAAASIYSNGSTLLIQAGYQPSVQAVEGSEVRESTYTEICEIGRCQDGTRLNDACRQAGPLRESHCADELVIDWVENHVCRGTESFPHPGESQPASSSLLL